MSEVPASDNGTDSARKPRSLTGRLVIVDLHVHTRGSSDCGSDPLRVVGAARRAGLNAIAVTDHGSIAEARALQAASGFPVIVGEEIRTSEGEIIGYFLTDPIPEGMTPEQTIDRIHAQGGLVCVPHPFDRFRRSPLARDALERVAHGVDMIEGLNARNLVGRDNALAQAWAAERGLPVVAGSDAHTYHEIGRARTELPPFASAAEFRPALSQAQLRGGRSTPLVHLVTAVRKRNPFRKR